MISLTTVLAALVSGCGAVGAWLAERLLGRLLGTSSSASSTKGAQQAVATEQKMAQDVADSPNQAAAVKDLDNGQV